MVMSKLQKEQGTFDTVLLELQKERGAFDTVLLELQKQRAVERSAQKEQAPARPQGAQGR